MCRGRVSSVLARVDFGGVWPRVLSTRARVQKQKRSKGPKKKLASFFRGTTDDACLVQVPRQIRIKGPEAKGQNRIVSCWTQLKSIHAVDRLLSIDPRGNGCFDRVGVWSTPSMCNWVEMS